MILLYERYGDKSNILFQNLHFEAYCKHNGLGYYNLELYPMESVYGIKNKISYGNIPNIIRPPISNRYKMMRLIAKILDWKIYDYTEGGGMKKTTVYMIYS